MQDRERFRHIRIADRTRGESYVFTGSPRNQPPLAPPDRHAHGAKLKQSLANAIEESSSPFPSDVVIEPTRGGYLLQVKGRPNVPIRAESLNNSPSRIRLRSVKVEGDPAGEWIQSAVVFIPRGKESHFIKKFDEYANLERTKKGNFKNDPLVSTLDEFTAATLLSLWTDRHELMPQPNVEAWWEVWIDGADEASVSDIIETIAKYQLETHPKMLAFGERTIVLVRATASELLNAHEFIAMAAELRKPASINGLVDSFSIEDQRQLVDDLLSRLYVAPSSQVAVCILDTGVFRLHPLIEPALADIDCHSLESHWNRFDDNGHGTQMAGIALFGDLDLAIGGTQLVSITHHLESVKLLPPLGNVNDPRLWGSLTAQAVSLPEIAAPDTSRVFLMPVTAATSGPYGEPSLWSASMDALATGRSFAVSDAGLEYFDDPEDGRQRLIIVSAGNADVFKSPIENYLDFCDLEVIADPAQAWNVLTVGAFSDRDTILDDAYQGFKAVGIRGDLSPFSTTSVLFGHQWPFKPDLVFEGGNIATDGSGLVEDRCPELTILSTSHEPQRGLFAFSNATSAASAGVAQMAVDLLAAYPQYRPETIRGLLVHSARWTGAMESHLPMGSGKKDSRERLLRRYGYGVPNLQRAKDSVSNRVTIVTEDTLFPFDTNGMEQIHFFMLPWPAEALESLGANEVQFRVTLSYFVDPNASRRSWNGVYRYASHGLRFDASDPNERFDSFRARCTRSAWEDQGKRPAPKDTDSSGWWFGKHKRVRGTIHTDTWQGTSAELSAMGYLAVYPVSGWRGKSAGDKQPARYSLVVSIESSSVDVDLYTAVLHKLSEKELELNSVPIRASTRIQ